MEEKRQFETRWLPLSTPSSCCEHEKWAHIIGSEEDCDSPECGPHDSFCVECDEPDGGHEWKPMPAVYGRP